MLLGFLGATPIKCLFSGSLNQCVACLPTLVQVPSIIWELKHDAGEMVKEHMKLMKWIDKQLKKRSEPFKYFGGTKMHKRSQTAKSGFYEEFKGISKAMAGKRRSCPCFLTQRPLPLLFLHNKWYFFEDASYTWKWT